MSARVYLGGLPDSVNLDDIHKHLSIYGRITEVKLRSGYAFVQFSSEKIAQDVVHTFANRPFLGSDAHVEIARPDKHTSSRVRTAHTNGSTVSPAIRPPPRQGKAKYAVNVKGLHVRTCWQELKDFARLLGGEVAYCDINRMDRTQGFINYTNERDAERAVQELDGKELQGHILRLSRHSGRESSGRKRERNDRSRSPIPIRYEPGDGLPHRTRERHTKLSSRSDGDWRDRSFYESFDSDRDLGARDSRASAPLRIWGKYGVPSTSSKDPDVDWSVDHHPRLHPDNHGVHYPLDPYL